jgi:hypothetical protein
MAPLRKNRFQFSRAGREGSCFVYPSKLMARRTERKTNFTSSFPSTQEINGPSSSRLQLAATCGMVAKDRINTQAVFFLLAKFRQKSK